MTTTPEPKDKLDAMTGRTVAVPGAAVVVNGPEDDILDWDADRLADRGGDVRRLRQRIFTASQAGDLKGSVICRS